MAWTSGSLRADGPAAPRRLVAQVDQVHRRQRPVERRGWACVSSVYWPRWALCQLSSDGVAEPSRIGMFSQPGAHDGHVAAVVARRRVLLEARLVLLVDDDQAEVRGRGRTRRCGADDDLHLAVEDAPPVPAALGVAEVAVQHGHVAEAAAEAGDGLRRQADLGHEDDAPACPGGPPRRWRGGRSRSCRCR